MTDTSAPLVHIIVLNWNSSEDTTRCIRSLEALDYSNFRIVIVDNASQDGSESILRGRFPQYPFIQTGKNLGYGGGNNYGIRHALKEGADYVWIVNPDIVVEIDSLKEMVKAMENDSLIGIAGPEVIWKFRNIDSWMEGLSSSLQSALKKRLEEHRTPTLQEVKETKIVIGCSMLVRSQVFFDVGLIRDDFFMYHEEIEFNLRAKNYGWKMVICCHVRNLHFWNPMGKVRLISYYTPRNSILIARLQRRRRLQTMRAWLNPRQNFTLMKERCFEELGWRLAGILAGFLVPLTPPPSNQ